ncbi:aldo/keto reductase [Xanthomonas axonopodis pv. martyniicola]|uniref:aldo/keto reductase n=1 Tax=Xanthomonas axonopodis TaxID=53413 RepID=UPI0009988796|nr:aldo/keto reductase [Xanthomonas axonopodis]OOW70488.1 aldo/keto reductase [Xanthomonas axonopodis pv. martyniicola]OOW97390.1 aldo/keto reductase [Xanthomonas campestris pv. vitiscarnosae]
METRLLGRSGFKVPVLGLGAGTFGGKGPLFSAWGDTDVAQARRMIDLCLDAGLNLFDTADVYSDGASEDILGQALQGRRDQVILSTKTGLRLGDGPNDAGASRFRLLRAVEACLRRLRTDHIDLLQLHAFDAMTPMEETLSTLDGLVRAGKVRYLGASNYSGWQLMKSQAVADAHGWNRFVANQTYYSLAGRDYEWELMPLGIDQGIGAVVWSPLGWGRLTGKLRRGQPLPQHSRLHATAAAGPAIDDARLFDIVEALDAIAAETGRSVPQIAINWLLRRPTVSTVLIGARDEVQLRENLGAVGWSLTGDQRARLDQASAVEPPYPYYPYWRGQFAERSPLPL